MLVKLFHCSISGQALGRLSAISRSRKDESSPGQPRAACATPLMLAASHARQATDCFVDTTYSPHGLVTSGQCGDGAIYSPHARAHVVCVCVD